MTKNSADKTNNITFTFITEFRGGIYCSQVVATNLKDSLNAWVQQLKKDKNEIKYVGNKVIDEINESISDPDNLPTELNELKNIWFTMYTTRMGSLYVNIVKTDTSE